MKLVGTSLLLLVVLASLGDAKPLKPSKILAALNCGLKEGFIKSDDIKYVSDTDFVKGNSVDVDYHSDSAASEAQIKFAMDKQVFMYERHTYSEMVYSLPVKTGKHTLILKFAEMYFQKKNQRVFTIKIGSQAIIQDMDVIAMAGSKYAAHEEFIEIQVKDGAVYYQGSKIANGIKQGKLQVAFTKGKADNPIIQAIIVYQGGIEETNKEQYTQLKKSWGSKQELLKAKRQNKKIKQLIEITKKKEKIVIRNDQLLAQQSTKTKQSGVKPEKFGAIRSFLMSPIGILIWTAIVIYKIVFLYKNVFKLDKKQPAKTA